MNTAAIPTDTHTVVIQTGTMVTPNPGGKFGEFMTAIEFNTICTTSSENSIIPDSSRNAIPKSK